MSFNDVLNQLNIVAQCKKNGLSLWQCPQFLFIIMGLVIIISALTTFSIASRFIEEPETAAIIVLLLSAFLLVISFLITHGSEKLAEAYRLKTEFISVVSHQLRSPLSNLQLAIELLMSGRVGKIEEEQTEYFKILKENSIRMQQLVSDLLIVSRIESEKMFFKSEEFSLADLVNNVILGFSVFAKSSNVNIELDFQSNPAKVLGDPNRIRLAVENFIDNAIRYTNQKGTVKISIQKNNGKIRFAVQDSGVGVPKNDQKYIFQKFFRAKNAMKYQTQGSGLGLHIAKAVIEKSGGKIGFDSQENKGSIFWFTLPIK